MQDYTFILLFLGLVLVVPITVSIIVLQIYIIFQNKYRGCYEEKIIIEEPEKIEEILKQYEDDENIFRIHHVRDLNKNYIQLTQYIKYKKNPKNGRIVELRPEIMLVEYYMKL